MVELCWLCAHHMFLKVNHVPIVLYISSKVMDGQKKIDVSALSSVINSRSVSFPLSQFTGGLGTIIDHAECEE